MIQSIIDWLNGPSGPAWIQAVGSIGAIWAALRVSNRQLAKVAEASKQESEDQVQAILAVGIGAGHYGEMWCDFVRKRPSSHDFRIFWTRSFADVIEASVHTMKQVPAHQLRKVELINAFNGVMSVLVVISSKTRSALGRGAFADQEIALTYNEISQDSALLQTYMNLLRAGLVDVGG
ncbi:hypothetical protein Q7C30_000210 [Pseudomonas sp. RAC1]|uniref:hypothetical protein n=1 Tax=Pseudomonas sp. RAC1 TaxID=3064900 RepID=UPI00271D826E|nr:hypothetical protein [Pseudomonas sp. RAC1]MDV9030526.1 hypothetical protein [Pseudomonas sp. RAC1]